MRCWDAWLAVIIIIGRRGDVPVAFVGQVRSRIGETRTRSPILLVVVGRVDNIYPRLFRIPLLLRPGSSPANLR
jgi:hypothetical protein